ncbi:MAG: hypothetical protein B7Z72_13530 [Gemmatimonadetes bacterium 21-71-4]|nr:MAG: hypothetical protein B7Z72_13530 [Gemmatimonadetes bacterium 21-71-4]
MTADLIAHALGAAGDRLAWRGAREALAPALDAFVRAGDVVLTMGAGDVTKTGGELVKLLEAR